MKPKQDKDQELLRDVANVTVGQPEAPLTKEYVESLGRSVFMIMDPEVITMLVNDRQLKNLLPAFSHLNRVTNIGKGREGAREAELLFLKYKILLIRHKLAMTEDQYEKMGWETLESLEIFARSIISDAREGWKGRLVTEQLKKVTVELEKVKKRLGF